MSEKRSPDCGVDEPEQFVASEERPLEALRLTVNPMPSERQLHVLALRLQGVIEKPATILVKVSR